MGNEWQVPPAALRCAGDGRAFEVGELFRTYLFETEQGYERREYCAGCRPADAAGLVGSWTSRRPAPEPRRRAVFDASGLLGLLRRLGDDTAPERQRLRFVLALLLWRKKLLKLLGTRDGAEGEVWEFVDAKDEEPLRMTRPELSDEQIERLSVQLSQILSGTAGGTEFASLLPVAGAGDA